MKKKMLIILMLSLLLCGCKKDEKKKEVQEETIIKITDEEYESYEDLHRILCGTSNVNDLLNIHTLNIGDEIKNEDLSEDIIVKASIRYLIEKDLFEIKESDDANSKYADIIEYVIKTEDIIKTAKEIFSKDIVNTLELIIDNGYEYKMEGNTYIARLLNTDYIPEEYEYSANNVSKNKNYYIVNVLGIKKNETMVACEDDECANSALNETMEYELKYKLEGKIYKFISIKRVK